jgi:hypothetical protein
LSRAGGPDRALYGPSALFVPNENDFRRDTAEAHVTSTSGALDERMLMNSVMRALSKQTLKNTVIKCPPIMAAISTQFHKKNSMV